MQENDELFETNRTDNTKRLMMSAICVLLLLVIAFCVYLLLFYNKSGADASSADESSFYVITPSESSAAESIEPSSEIEVNASTPDYSIPNDDDSSDVETSIDIPSQDEPNDSSEVSDESSQDEGGELDHQWYGYVYRYLNHAIEDFTPSASAKEAYVSSINALYSEIGKNSSFYHMIIPTQVEYLRSSFPPEVTSSNGDAFYSQRQSTFISYVGNNTLDGIINIDISEVFEEKYANNEYIYFNTDKNYTALGAYYAYLEFCKAAGLQAVSLDELTECTIDRFLGTFYTSTGSETLRENADSVIFYDLDEKFPAVVTIDVGSNKYKNQKMIYKNVSSVANGYNVFFGREAYNIEISVNNPTSDKSILIIGDLAAAPFAPYLAANYKTITFLNATCFNDRYFVSLPEFLKGKSYDDILVLDYSTSYKSPFFFSNNIISMLEQ